MNSQFERTIKLIGEENFNKLQNTTIAIFGLGGVGGTAFMALLRSGVKHFIVIDFDTVSESNLNRQILYTLDSVGNLKVEETKKYSTKINPEAEIITINQKINSDNISCLDKYKIDYMIDAIDDVSGKIAIAKYAEKRDIPLIVSLGMANRLSSENVIVTKLNKTTGDPLARKLRYEFKNNNIDISKIDVVFCKDEPLIKEATPYSMMMTPSSAGLAIGSFIIKNIIS